jgi:purine catabolism regulator
MRSHLERPMGKGSERMLRERSPGSGRSGPSVSTLSVREVLEHPALEGSRVVAGARGLDRSVVSITVLDVHDQESIQPGQFLLVNAYSLLDVDLLKVIPALHRKKCVALGLKLSGYWHDVPRTLVRAANSYGIPLVLMREGPFDEIVNPILTMITERQFLGLKRSHDLHDELTAAALRQGGDPAAIVSSVHRAIGKPVALFSSSGNLLTYDGNQDVWTDSLLPHAIKNRRSGYLRFGNDHWLITPIPGTGSTKGVLCAHGVEEHESFARAALAHAAIVIGMVQVERRQVEDVHRRFEREMLEDLVAGRLQREDDARERAAWLGWPLHQPFLVLALSLPNLIDDPSSQVAEETINDLETFLDPLQLEVRTFLWRVTVGMVAHLSTDEDALGAADRLRHMIERFTSERNIAVENITIGLGEPRSALTDLPSAFEEAALAMLLCRSKGDRMHAFRELGPARLLCHAMDQEGLIRTARDVLGDLYPGESKRDGELFDTLSSLLASNMSVRSTAEELYFHYNTVRHRLGRLRSSLGQLLDDPYGRLELSAAVSVIRLLEARSRFGGIGALRN